MKPHDSIAKFLLCYILLTGAAILYTVVIPLALTIYYRNTVGYTKGGEIMRVGWVEPWPSIIHPFVFKGMWQNDHLGNFHGACYFDELSISRNGK